MSFGHTDMRFLNIVWSVFYDRQNVEAIQKMRIAVTVAFT